MRSSNRSAEEWKRGLGPWNMLRRRTPRSDLRRRTKTIPSPDPGSWPSGPTAIRIAPDLQSRGLRVDPARFFRIHRRYLVNLSHAGEILPSDEGNYRIMMRDEVRSGVPLSRRQARRLRARFPW